MGLPASTLPPHADYAQVHAWLLEVDPEILAASFEVDGTLSADNRRLAPEERLARAVATQRWATRTRGEALAAGVAPVGTLPGTRRGHST